MKESSSVGGGDIDMTAQREQDERQQKLPSLQGFFSTFVAVINIPPYTMLSCVVLYSFLFYTIPSVSARTFLALYLIYGILDPTPQSPTKPRLVEKLQPYCNKIWFFRWTAQYFPCQLHKTCDLSPNDNTYLFAYHPHGVIGMGCCTGLCTDASDFHKMFPGIRRSGVTLNFCFWVPFFRDWLLANGFCSANKSTLKSRLVNQESLVLIPGGASEALHAHAKQMKFTILKRKGFIKLALETRASIVPVIGFGENDVFDTLYVGNEQVSTTTTKTNNSSSGGTAPPKFLATSLWKVQKALKQVFSFSTPILTNPIPHRRPIHVVIGKPIQFDASSQTVDQCHALYLDALRKLYEGHKTAYGYEDVPLEFV